MKGNCQTLFFFSELFADDSIQKRPTFESVSGRSVRRPETGWNQGIPVGIELRFNIATGAGQHKNRLAMSDRRTQFSLRIGAAEKEKFSAAAERCGIDPSAAARQLIELVVQRIDAGGDFLDAVHELKTAWGVPRKSDLELRLESLNKALSTFKPRADQDDLLSKIEDLERELQQHGKSASDGRKKHAQNS